MSKVQEKVQIERSASQRLGSSSQAQRGPARPQPKAQPAIDLFGDDPTPPRASSGPPVSRPAPPKAEPAPPKQAKAGDSLLGLDFLGGGTSTPPARPSSTGPASAAPSRPDLKQSILSLYASAPKPAPQPQQHGRQDSFGGLGSVQAQQSPQQSSFGGMNDAFSSLSFSSQPAPPQPKPSAFAGLDTLSSTRSPPSTSSNLFGGGGGFFDSTPKSPPQAKPQQHKPSNSGLGDFSSFTSPVSAAPAKSAAPSSGMNDLLDLSMPSTAPPQTMASPPITSPSTNSAFNLSSPSAPIASKPAPATTQAPNYSGFSNLEGWGSTDAWATPAPPQTTSTTASAPPPQVKSPGGWGGTTSVAQDDDFGGWSSATPAAPQTSLHSQPAASKPAGFGGSDDLFSNVWE